MPSVTSTYDFVLVGGGVIGLSVAYELGRNGHRVCVLERGQTGREASWAGAGILPPGSNSPEADPLEQFIAWSSGLHAEWAGRLREETGMDTGYRRTGGLYVARDAQDYDQLQVAACRWQRLGVKLQRLCAEEVRDREPALAGSIRGAYLLSEEAQLRNPHHLNALEAACRRCQVDIFSDSPVEFVRLVDDRIEHVQTPSGRFSGGEYCLAAGAWTSSLAGQLGFQVPIFPVRGQMVLLKCSRQVLTRIVNEQLRYLVPRDDGRVLVGSTMENAGFDSSTTARGIAGLLEFALQLSPPLADCPVERTWAGLRPATLDGLPLVGRLPNVANGWIASGHHRCGLTLSPGTAEIVASLMRGLPSKWNPAPFAPQRPMEHRPSASKGLPELPATLRA